MSEETAVPAADDAKSADKAGDAQAAPIEPAKPVRRVYASVQWSLVGAMIVLAFAMLLKIGALNIEVKKDKAELAQQAAASARAQQVLDVLTARTAQQVLLTAANAHPAPAARAVYLASNGGLIFQAYNLAAIPADKTYELWVIPSDGKAPIPAGLFRPDAAGNASVILPPLPRGVQVKAFGVTMEKAEGSQTPTPPFLLSGAAPGAGQ